MYIMLFEVRYSSCLCPWTISELDLRELFYLRLFVN
jgi:hypothetical protein